jgi:hypothetical protein
MGRVGDSVMGGLLLPKAKTSKLSFFFDGCFQSLMGRESCCSKSVMGLKVLFLFSDANEGCDDSVVGMKDIPCDNS